MWYNLAIRGQEVGKQVTFILTDDEHKRAGVFVSDKHIGYEAYKAFMEWITRREARTRRAQRERGEA